MNLIETGIITNTHGLRGDLKVQGWCDSLEFLMEFDTFYLKDGSPLEVISSKIHKNMLLIKFRGYEDISSAEKLKNQVIFIDKDDTELDDGEYFIADLIGCSVYEKNTDKLIGVISDVIQTGANDVYILNSENNGGKEILIPVIDDVIENIDIENKKIQINILPGLLD